MKTERVLLPKKVAFALECIIGERGKTWCENKPAIVKAAKKNRNLKILVDYMNDKQNGYEMLQEATYVGYRVDASPEEKLRIYYNEADLFEKKGITKTLELLEIKIEGIT
jgi:hypothetical protein